MINLEELSNIFIQSTDELLDVTDCVTSVEIYQNIYNPFVTGMMSLIDTPSSRLSKQFKKQTLVGSGEKIIFSITTRTMPASRENKLIIKDYYVYKMQVLPLDSTGEDSMFKQSIILHFCSAAMFENEMKKISEFHFDTISNVVGKIAGNYLNLTEMVLEDTKEKQFIMIPNISPLKAITWLTTRAYAPSPTVSEPPNLKNNKKQDEKVNYNFVFYEDIEHNFYFTSLGSLFKRPPILGKQDTDGIRIETAASEDALGKVSYKGSFAGIQHIGKSVSPFSNLKNGMYSSTCLTFDLTRKKYAKKTMRYDELFDKQDHIYNKQLVDPKLETKINEAYSNPDAVIKYYPKSSYLFNPNENLLKSDNPTNTVDKWLLERIAAEESMDQVGVDVEIRGNVGIQLGDVVYFSRPQLEYSSDPSLTGFDPLFTGKFLITKIKHVLENKGDNFGFNLRTSLSLRRDSKYIPTSEEMGV